MSLPLQTSEVNLSAVSSELTPTAAGYRMPAEWEPHAATWLSWPRPEGISFPGKYNEIVPTLAAMVDALADSESVHINVANTEEELRVRDQLKNVRTDHVRFFHIQTNEPWCRDHGPIFLTRKQANASVAIVDFDYNAWGGKYPPFDADDEVPTHIARLLGGLPVYYPRVILEGGSIDLNGSGTVLTTESCLLNPNRNPSLSKTDLENVLCQYLGVSNVLWLGDGIEGDDTDGHVDDLTRFVDRTTVVTVIEENTNDSNYKALKTNFELLQTMCVEDGKPITVKTLPMPSPVYIENTRMPASYANFYIANRVVLLPVFDDSKDAEAVNTLQSLFPTRKVVPISCRKLIWGLGAFHCLTQQQPKWPIMEAAAA